MTVAERLNSKLLGLVPDVDGLLIDEGFELNDEYTKDIGETAEFQIAYANGLIEILMNPNLSEGDWSRSWGDRSAIERIVSSIFNKYAPDENPFSATMVNISNRW